MIDVAIVGAGMAGLACARRLAQTGLRRVLFDKGRVIGGRVTTRRVDELRYDHGARCVTARGEGFAAVPRDLATSGAAAPWPDGSGRARVVGVPGMSAPAGAMGEGLDVRLNAQDSSKPGSRSGAAVSWAAQAGPGLGVEHLEADPAALAALMLPLLCDSLGVSSATVANAAAHRWRYARVAAPPGQPFLREPDATLHLGDNWSVGPRVEEAWTSCAAIADDLPGTAR